MYLARLASLTRPAHTATSWCQEMRPLALVALPPVQRRGNISCGVDMLHIIPLFSSFGLNGVIIVFLWFMHIEATEHDHKL